MRPHPQTKPFGFMPFYPGPGLGGHCIPLDPYYLTWKAAEHGNWTRFIELEGEVNTSMLRYVVERTILALNEEEKSVKSSRIFVLGLSCKADVDHDRESPSFELIKRFRGVGADVAYCDPHIPESARGAQIRPRPRLRRVHARGVRPILCDRPLHGAPAVQRPGPLPRRETRRRHAESGAENEGPPHRESVNRPVGERRSCEALMDGATRCTWIQRQSPEERLT